MPDPLNPQSWDRYSYVLNNPLRYIDPSGHFYDPPPLIEGLCTVEGCLRNPSAITSGNEYSEWAEVDPLPSPTNIPNPEARSPYVVNSTLNQYDIARLAIYIKYGWKYIDPSGKIKDNAIIALIIAGELELLKGTYTEAYFEGIEAISNQYYSVKKPSGGMLCNGSCTMTTQITWLYDMESFRSRAPHNLRWENYIGDAGLAMEGYSKGADTSWFWGNVTEADKANYNIVIEIKDQYISNVKGRPWFIIHSGRNWER